MAQVIAAVFSAVIAYAPSASAGQDVAFTDLGGDQCFMFSLLLPAGNRRVSGPFTLIIESEQDYANLFAAKLVRKSCESADLARLVPKVDFSKQTVLGLWAAGDCTDTGFDKTVKRDDIAKTVTYSVRKVGAPRACMGPGPESLNLIAVPKIAPGFSVVFQPLQDAAAQ